MSIMAKILLSILLLIVMCALTAFFTWPDSPSRAQKEASFAYKVSLLIVGLGALECLLLFGWAFYGIWTS